MKRLFILSLILTITSFSLGQEIPPAEELLQWLPAADYMHVEVICLVSMVGTESWPIYQEYLHDQGKYMLLPESFQEKVTIKIAARFGKLYKQREKIVKLEKEIATAEKQKRKERRMMILEKSAFKAVNSVAVFHIADVQDLIIKGIEQGFVFESSVKAGDIRVYEFRVKNQFTRRSCLAYLMPAGELLVSEKKELLDKMVAASKNEIPRFADLREYDEFVRLLPELGQKWKVSFDQKLVQLQGESSAEIEDMAENPARAFMKVETLTLDEQILKTDYGYYLGSDYAEYAVKKQKQPPLSPISNLPAEIVGARNAEHQKKKFEREDNVCIVTLLLTKELLKSREVTMGKIRTFFINEEEKMIKLQKSKGEEK